MIGDKTQQTENEIFWWMIKILFLVILPLLKNWNTEEGKLINLDECLIFFDIILSTQGI